MDGNTFRSRLLALIQKSRQAYRLYTSVGRLPRAANNSEYTETQALQWRSVNADLIKTLGLAAESRDAKVMVREVFMLRERMYDEFRLGEADMRQKQRELTACAESGDFIRASLLSKELVAIKAKVEACQAAHHELDDLVTKSKITAPREAPISLPEEQVIVPTERLAKVIPLRKH
ncbi:MAG: hypothetical protein DCC75_06735 [Proteobacteria bacterium]|nr:MAG: hypothetical protein DCC75_06735 [Pseudomonadota bacterium]